MLKKLKKMISKVWNIIKKPEMKVLPGHLAFFLFLSVVPIITLIGYASSFFGLSMDVILNFLKSSFSDEIAALLAPMIQGKSFDFELFFFLIVSYTIASNGAHSIIVATNAIYKTNEDVYLKKRIKAIFMTFFLVLLFIFILIVPVFGDKIILLVDSVYPNTMLIKVLKMAFPFLSAPITLFTIFFFVKIIYTMAPDKKTHSVTVNKGSIFTAIFWYIITQIYTYYLHHLANYDLFYGGLSNIVVLMLWVYFLAYVLVIGIALNASEEESYLEKTGTIKIKDV